MHQKEHQMRTCPEIERDQHPGTVPSSFLSSKSKLVTVETVDTVFSVRWYHEILELAESIGVTESIPRAITALQESDCYTIACVIVAEVAARRGTRTR